MSFRHQNAVIEYQLEDYDFDKIVFFEITVSHSEGENRFGCYFDGLDEIEMKDVIAQIEEPGGDQEVIFKLCQNKARNIRDDIRHFYSHCITVNKAHQKVKFESSYIFRHGRQSRPCFDPDKHRIIASFTVSFQTILPIFQHLLYSLQLYYNNETDEIFAKLEEDITEEEPKPFHSFIHQNATLHYYPDPKITFEIIVTHHDSADTFRSCLSDLSYVQMQNLISDMEQASDDPETTSEHSITHPDESEQPVLITLQKKVNWECCINPSAPVLTAPLSVMRPILQHLLQSLELFNNEQVDQIKLIV